MWISWRELKPKKKFDLWIYHTPDSQIAGITSDFKMVISKYLITSAELEVNLVPRDSLPFLFSRRLLTVRVTVF